MKVDLHLHTTFSDGILTPQNLVKFAKLVGNNIISITDHDTVKGVPYAIDMANQIGIIVIPGVEISTYYNNAEFHILGYDIDYEDKELNELFETMKYHRKERIKKILNLLKQHFGIEISFDEVEKTFKSNNYGRPHIAILLYQKGYSSSVMDSFEKYLYDGGPCDVPKFYYSVKDAIDMIHKKGGIAVLAHPGIYYSQKNFDKLKKFIFLHNFDGIEVFHPDNTPMLKELFYFAQKNNYIITGGSDYHGYLNKTNFGFEIPFKLLSLQNLITKKRSYL